MATIALTGREKYKQTDKQKTVSITCILMLWLEFVALLSCLASAKHV